jgi:hypothetical protein
MSWLTEKAYRCDGCEEQVDNCAWRVEFVDPPFELWEFCSFACLATWSEKFYSGERTPRTIEKSERSDSGAID